MLAWSGQLVQQSFSVIFLHVYALVNVLLLVWTAHPIDTAYYISLQQVDFSCLQQCSQLV